MIVFSYVTNWYTKDIWSERYINYFSNCPLKYKVNTIYNLVDRAINLSEKRFHTSNIEKIKMTLVKNFYPLEFINKYVKKRMNFLKNKTQNAALNKNKNDVENVYVGMPYIPKLTENIEKILRQEKSSIRVCPKNLNTLKSLFSKLKAPIPKDHLSNLIYQIKCKDCNSSYVGQTQNYIKDRINTHRRSIRNMRSDTALSRHALENLHNFDFVNYKILDMEHNRKKRLVKEMAHIRTTEHSINYIEDTQNLNNLYDVILHEKT